MTINYKGDGNATKTTSPREDITIRPSRTMDPRSRLLFKRARCPAQLPRQLQRRSATAAAAIAVAPAPTIDQTAHSVPPTEYPLSQPPSHKPPEFRKSQLHRHYTSLLRSSPLILLFQHSNLRSTEWLGIRRELAAALRRVDESQATAAAAEAAAALAAAPSTTTKTKTKARPAQIPDSTAIKLQIVQTGIFASALQVVEFYHPDSHDPTSTSATNPDTSISPAKPTPTTTDAHTHYLSRKAWQTARNNSFGKTHGLEPLLSGPLALLAFPTVSPAHLAAALTILAPGGAFPRAPTQDQSQLSRAGRADRFAEVDAFGGEGGRTGRGTVRGPGGWVDCRG